MGESKRGRQKNNLLRNLVHMIGQMVSEMRNKVSEGTMSCVNFTRSELFVIMIIVVLSLAIFVIQLVQ